MRKVIQQNNTRKRYKDSVTYRQRNTETLRDWESKKSKRGTRKSKNRKVTESDRNEEKVTGK